MNYKTIRKKIVFLITMIFMISCVSGCNNITVETYENAEEFQTGNFSCAADEVKTIEIYWRSGNINIEDCDENNISVSESGENLSEGEQLHYCLKDGTLEIRFAMSGEKLNISPNNKCLQVRIPKSIALNIHSTSADVIAEKLEHDNILIATMSGNVEITEIVSNNADFSSNSGHIELDMIVSDKLSLSTSSGHIKCNSVQVDTVDAKSSTGDISFGNIIDSNIVVKTSSGDIILSLPDEGITVDYATDSGKLKTQQEYEKIGDLYKFGKGCADLMVQSSSGDLKIE